MREDRNGPLLLAKSAPGRGKKKEKKGKKRKQISDYEQRRKRSM
jgi:hypothetical protein